MSELLPYTAKVADRLTFIKSLHTEAINHDPAVTMLQTGFQIGGRPSMGGGFLGVDRKRDGVKIRFKIRGDDLAGEGRRHGSCW